MDPTVDSRIKFLDVGIPVLQNEYEGRVVEHISSAE
jgi:hypothetical protein